MELTSNRCSANSVTFVLKDEAVLVWKSEKAITAQNIHGSSKTFCHSNFSFFSVSCSFVALSRRPLKFRSLYLLKNQNTTVAALVNRFMKTEVQNDQAKFPVF